MPTFRIENVDVDFPFQPYECQKEYMGKVIRSLQNKENAILESPTGTGKTLCLLCATLSWMQMFKASDQLSQKLCKSTTGFQDSLEKELLQASGMENEVKSSFTGGFKIIYASRTHTQLCQVVQELRSTVFRPKVSIIGSREQLCINPEVLKQESNAAKVHMCRAKVAARTCNFFNNLDAMKSDKEFKSDILDIEDLVKLGQKHRACPYYMARELNTEADIVFMPYNYLLDPKSAKAHGLDLQGSVIIFDEAHNIEKICEDNVSFDLSSFDIASCVEDVLLCLEVLAGNEMEDIEGNVEKDINIEDVKMLKALFSKLEEEIDAIQLPKEGGKSFPGSFIIELMRKCGITSNTQAELLVLLGKLNPLLADDTKGIKGNHFALSKFADALQLIFKFDPNNPNKHEEQTTSFENCKSYKVYLKIEQDSKKKQKNLDVWTSGTKTTKKGRTLSYWCFSPGLAMKKLAANNVRSIILTSGTLSPLSSFKSELQIHFKNSLENPHVIEKHQVWVGIVTKAPDGATLNSSFEFRSTTEYMTGLGNSIANFSRIVPNGLLVFFPSYPVMNKCLEHWQNNGIWSRITQNKPAFAEPKGKGEFAETIEDFYSKILDPTYNGATLFAVCRGKVSEGVDFSDINGRAVVITGLPFPPKLDPKVNLKMNFLDEAIRQKAKDSRFVRLTGREWYRQQATRAVNQAIGRVIRHKQDFGAIILCDVRFTYPDSISQLPSWIRPHVKVFKEFGGVQRELIQFFRNADKMVDKSAMKTKQKSIEEINGCQDVQESDDVMHQEANSSQQMESAMQFSRPKASLEVPKSRKQPVKSKLHEAHLPRLSIEYEEKEYKPKDVVARPKASLVDSLASSEASLCCRLSKKEEDYTMPSISDSIIGKRPINNQHKTKKVYKIVKTKQRPKIKEAKEYLSKVRQTLNEDDYKDFSKVLMQYKKANDLEALITGLTPLFAKDQSKYELFLDFSSFVRHCDDKLTFFNAYRRITGQDVPDVYLDEVKGKKRQEPDHEQICKVGKRIKLENTCEQEQGFSKDSIKDKGASSNLVFLDNITHLNKDI